MPQKQNTQAEAMDKALSLLSLRGHSRRELYLKLIKRKYGKNTVNGVLDECERLGLLNDRQFAVDLQEELKRRGYGPYRIRASMAKKGVAVAIIDELLADLDGESEAERARQALERKRMSLRRESDPRKRRDKAFRFLAGRGFVADTICRVLEMSDLF